MAKKTAKSTPTKKKSATKKSPAKKSPVKKAPLKKGGVTKNSLVANINRRKREGTSRSKQDSTVAPGAYKDMQAGWPNSKKNLAAAAKPTKKAAKRAKK